MPSKATVTGVVGPAVSLTAAVFTNVTNLALNCLQNVLSLDSDQGHKDIDIGAATTFTVTISAKTYTVTVS